MRNAALNMGQLGSLYVTLAITSEAADGSVPGLDIRYSRMVNSAVFEMIWPGLGGISLSMKARQPVECRI